MHSTSYQQSRVRNRSNSAAGHRHAFWAKNDTTLKILHANPRQKSKADLAATSPDYFENFSYDPEHMTQFVMPKGLLDRLPDCLTEVSRNWQKACAALCTALERAEVFHNKAAAKAYPNGPRRNSVQAVVGAEKPIDSPIALTLPPPIGMESPPYTPYDSFGCTTPLDTNLAMQKTVDLSRINQELSPLSLPDDLYPVRTIEAGFNENSWEHYSERYESQIKDCEIALQRVRGYGRTMNLLLVEQRLMLKPEVKLAVMEFDKWWVAMKPKSEALGERVRFLEVPTLGEATAMARARGLCG